MCKESYCPLMGGKPCMGKQCAMATYTWHTPSQTRTWRCGVPHVDDMEARSPIEEECFDITTGKEDK